VIIRKSAIGCNPDIASKTGNEMAEGKSAIPAYNYLIVSHFLSLLVFTPHFAPQNFLSFMAFKGHGSFV